MPLNRHDWAAVDAKVAFIAMLRRVLVEYGLSVMKCFLQKTIWFLGFLGVAVSLTGYAQACSTPALTGAHSAMVPAKLPDSALFDSAVLHYVNKVRCLKGCQR